MSEPSNSELARRLDDIQRMVAGLVVYPEYRESQRGIDRRFAELAQDIEELRRQQAEHVKATADHRMQWRSLILTGVLPALVAAIGILVTVLLYHGGH